jgi:hypothetical protein
MTDRTERTDYTVYGIARTHTHTYTTIHTHMRILTCRHKHTHTHILYTPHTLLTHTRHEHMPPDTAGDGKIGACYRVGRRRRGYVPQLAV